MRSEATNCSRGGDFPLCIILVGVGDKRDVADLSKLFVTNAQGERIPLSSVATYEETTAPSSISRKDQTRTATVTAVPKKVDALVAENIVTDETLSFAVAGGFSPPALYSSTVITSRST